MAAAYEEIICTFPLFTGYTRHGAQELLECGQVTVCEPGMTLFREGDQADSVLLILEGHLQVFAQRDGRDLVLTNPGPGTIVGELAVLCGIPRAASVRAAESATVLKWDGRAFRRLLIGNVFLSQRILGEALRGLIEKERSLIDSVMREGRS